VIRRLFGRKGRSPAGEAERGGREEPASGPSLRTDLHSHLLPGIDDGAGEMETSLKLLEGLFALGYRRIVTTPHVMADSYRNSSEKILDGLEELKNAARQKGVEMELHAAAEYYMDEEFSRRLEAGDILTIGGEWVLFETSYYNKPLGFRERIYEISARGYRPMLAHPERYRYVKDPEKFYGRLREMGVGFQVNINSLGGYYGREARAKALWLSERGWIDFLGSDLHGAKQLEFLKRTLAGGLVHETLRNNTLLNDTLSLIEN